AGGGGGGEPGQQEAGVAPFGGATPAADPPDGAADDRASVGGVGEERRSLPPTVISAVLRFVLFRVLQTLVALTLLSVVVFVLARTTGDPLHLILPMSATAEDYANARRYLGLDRPYVEQYLSFVGKAVTG